MKGQPMTPSEEKGQRVLAEPSIRESKGEEVAERKYGAPVKALVIGGKSPNQYERQRLESPVSKQGYRDLVLSLVELGVMDTEQGQALLDKHVGGV